ncbi:Hsp20/alpha crystallin family protein [Fulvivirga marina]|nr:Hsp20/alpha crystallin family protein [Fulvivirga marina]
MKRSNDLFPSLFDDFFGRDWFNAGVSAQPTMPAVNLKEKDDNFEVELAAPGMNKNDFKIELDNNLLTISCEKEEAHEEGEGQYARREFNYRSFQRSFTLPNTIESDKINAKYVDGVLKLTIPKKEEAKKRTSRQIAIS